MWGKFALAFVVAVIGGMIPSIIEVDAQSTVDDSASCESSSFDEAVNLIREDLEAAKFIREDLKDVKNLLGSNQQQHNGTCISKKDVEELKAACASNQQLNNTSSTFKKDLEDLKACLLYTSPSPRDS